MSEHLKALLNKMRGPWLGDGFTNISRDELLAALSAEPPARPSVEPDGHVLLAGDLVSWGPKVPPLWSCLRTQPIYLVCPSVKGGEAHDIGELIKAGAWDMKGGWPRLVERVDRLVAIASRSLEGGEVAAQPAGEALTALKAAQSFIRNGVALGYIRMPDADCPDTAHNTPKLIDAAIDALAHPPKPEPLAAQPERAVAWIVDGTEVDNFGAKVHEREIDWFADDIKHLPVGTKLYTPAPQAQLAEGASEQPHVAADEDGNATLEWWRGSRKLTFYTVAKPDEALLKSWGPNMETEMEYVPLTDATAVAAAFAWLTTPQVPSEPAPIVAQGVGAAVPGGPK